MIEENIVPAPFPAALAELEQKLNGYRYAWKRVYVGITRSPEARWEQHAQDGWHKMALVYRAFSGGIARDVERHLIDYSRRCDFTLELTNRGLGGEGLRDAPGICFVYILVADRRGVTLRQRRPG